MQPVSYASLALTLGTGAGLVWYYNHLKEQKLAGACLLALSSVLRQGCPQERADAMLHAAAHTHTLQRPQCLLIHRKIPYVRSKAVLCMQP